ncbi:hypothetical protein D3C86_2161290 [compost metagenome]
MIGLLPGVALGRDVAQRAPFHQAQLVVQRTGGGQLDIAVDDKILGAVHLAQAQLVTVGQFGPVGQDAGQKRF